MRLALLITLILAIFLIAALIYVMIVQAHNPTFNGYGIAAIISSIAALISGTAYMKKEQRRFEHDRDPGENFNHNENTGQNY